MSDLLQLLIEAELATQLHHNVDESDGEHYTSIGVSSNQQAAETALSVVARHLEAVDARGIKYGDTDRQRLENLFSALSNTQPTEQATPDLGTTERQS